MSWLILLAIVVVLLVLRQSLVLVFAVAAAYIHVFIANSKLEFLLQDFWFTVDREVLLSIPHFAQGCRNSQARYTPPTA